MLLTESSRLLKGSRGYVLNMALERRTEMSNHLGCDGGSRYRNRV